MNGLKILLIALFIVITGALIKTVIMLNDVKSKYDNAVAQFREKIQEKDAIELYLNR